MYSLLRSAESTKQLFLQSRCVLNNVTDFTEREKCYIKRERKLNCFLSVQVWGNPFLRLFPLFKVPFRGAPLNNVRDVRLVVEDLHDLRARLVDAVHDDLATLHVALQQLVNPFNFRRLLRSRLHVLQHLV